ncbi:MAG: ABC transporter permease [Candidatus Koribacter versatilis]|uniref:ABC transporter permease n=1 Tax=Candidatus Korobacter versatilis TaxID=658062 RepID=A0A932A873_9BACT|nr:ABC transporter permease [Candidatus Koribacter versatilis]
MDVMAIIRIAMRALARNKMRSGLTMLGIIIGVGAVIAMVGIGQGAQQQVQQQIAAMGSNILFVSSGTVNRGGMRMGWGATKTLVYDDMRAIMREAPAVRMAAPGSQTTAQVVFGNDNWSTNINGTEPQYLDIRNWPLQEGSNFTQNDVDMAANVAIVGETVRKNLFGATDSVGQTIRIKSLPFKVVGVLVPKGQSAAMGQDQDDTIIIPITTLQKKMTGDTWLRWIMVSADSKEASYAAQQQIEGLLRDRHRIRPGTDDDFFVRNLADIADLQDQASQVFTLLLAAIASVSLLVGGIGIMNIMLVSVTERTREIGIRMAIGATESDVQRQFLIEAVVLSLIGGGIGILFGLSSGFLISALLHWPVLISPLSIVVAAIFSAAVGIFFGFYPARKAARLDPIEALRYE